MTRFLAKLIDWILLFIVLMIVFGLIFAGWLFSAALEGGNMFTGGGIGYTIVSTIVSTAIVVGYFTLMEANNGQTIGKMLLKIQVQRPDGSTPSMEEALRRNAYLGLYLLTVIPVLGGILASLGVLAAVIYIAVTINNNTTTRQGWHDEFAGGTKVIKIG
jgi:uncharacterized RDD family membrane protein YckC